MSAMSLEIGTTTVTIGLACSVCGTRKTLTLGLDPFLAWMEGELIQNAFPKMAPADREMMVSGLCEPCFDDLFSVID